RSCCPRSPTGSAVWCRTVTRSLIAATSRAAAAARARSTSSASSRTTIRTTAPTTGRISRLAGLELVEAGDQSVVPGEPVGRGGAGSRRGRSDRQHLGGRAGRAACRGQRALELGGGGRAIIGADRGAHAAPDGERHAAHLAVVGVSLAQEVELVRLPVAGAAIDQIAELIGAAGGAFVGGEHRLVILLAELAAVHPVLA